MDTLKQNNLESIAKKVICIFSHGKEELIYTCFSGDDEAFYSLIQSKPAHLLKFPALPSKIDFFQIPKINPQDFEKVTQSQKKLTFLKSSFEELDLQAFKEGILSPWAHSALHTEEWTTVQKNFFVLVCNHDETLFELKLKQLKNWKLTKDKVIRDKVEEETKNRKKTVPTFHRFKPLKIEK